MKAFLLGAALLAAVGATKVQAGIVSWDFGQHPGLLGAVQDFTAFGDTIQARGFTGGDIGTRLFSKLGGANENGLGLSNDPSGDDEITGRNFITINVDQATAKGLSDFVFNMESVDHQEGWKVFGSNDDHPFQFTLLVQNNGLHDEDFHLLQPGFDNYSFFYSGNGPGACGRGCNANVLLSSFAATLTVPEPSTWATMLIGFGTLGLLGWAAKRKSAIA